MTFLLRYTASLLPSCCTTPRSEPRQKRAARIVMPPDARLPESDREATMGDESPHPRCNHADAGARGQPRSSSRR